MEVTNTPCKDACNNESFGEMQMKISMRSDYVPTTQMTRDSTKAGRERETSGSLTELAPAQTRASLLLTSTLLISGSFLKS